MTFRKWPSNGYWPYIANDENQYTAVHVMLYAICVHLCLISSAYAFFIFNSLFYLVWIMNPLIHIEKKQFKIPFVFCRSLYLEWFFFVFFLTYGRNVITLPQFLITFALSEALYLLIINLKFEKTGLVIYQMTQERWLLIAWLKWNREAKEYLCLLLMITRWHKS